VVNQKLFDDINARIKEVMSNSPARDIERNVRAMLATTFTKLDLVTREEFDVQSAVLARTREALDRMEVKLAALEQRLKEKN